MGSWNRPKWSMRIRLFSSLNPRMRIPAQPGLPAGRHAQPAAIAKFGDDIARNPVGTGPFKLEEWVPKTRLVIAKNPTYWGTPVKLDKVIFRPFPEEATRLLAFQAGELDAIQDPVRRASRPCQRPSLQSRPGDPAAQSVVGH